MPEDNQTVSGLTSIDSTQVSLGDLLYLISTATSEADRSITIGNFRDAIVSLLGENSIAPSKILGLVDSLTSKVSIAQKGTPYGVAPLNGSSKIPEQYLDIDAIERVEHSFTQANLSIQGLLPINHSMGKFPSSVKVKDNAGNLVFFDDWQDVDLNTGILHLQTAVPISGQWQIILGG
jgi:hypothetical protein